MNNLMTVHTLGPKLIEALGVPKHCTWLELRLAFNEIPTVTCEYYPVGDDGTIDLASKVLAEYELVPRATPAAVESHPAEVIGFDAWMRERNEAAHQEMMAAARAAGRVNAWHAAFTTAMVARMKSFGMHITDNGIYFKGPIVNGQE